MSDMQAMLHPMSCPVADMHLLVHASMAVISSMYPHKDLASSPDSMSIIPAGIPPSLPGSLVVLSMAIIFIIMHENKSPNAGVSTDLQIGPKSGVDESSPAFSVSINCMKPVH
jgi:hypothetical protein